MNHLATRSLPQVVADGHWYGTSAQPHYSMVDVATRGPHPVQTWMTSVLSTSLDILHIVSFPGMLLDQLTLWTCQVFPAHKPSPVYGCFQLRLVSPYGQSNNRRSVENSWGRPSYQQSRDEGGLLHDHSLWPHCSHHAPVLLRHIFLTCP